MSASKLTITAGTRADIVAAIPARLVRKFDEADNPAQSWTWQGHEVTTDTDECVTIAASADDVATSLSCSCLLSPRCRHVLAVAHAIPLAKQPQPRENTEADADTSSEVERALVDLNDRQRQAARALWEAASHALAMGVDNAATLVQARLLRAAHEAKGQKLYRIASDSVTLVEEIRAARGTQVDFDRNHLRSVFAGLLRCCALLADADAADLDIVGRGRRRYSAVSSLVLHGVFSEPVITRSGFAGVTTYLVTSDGRLLTVNDVLPGQADQARFTYNKAIGVGEVLVTHRDLCRSALQLQRGTVSGDGRIGRPADARAAVATRDRSLVESLWKIPVASQLCRDHAPRDDNVIFFEATVIGFSNDAVVFTDDAGEVYGRAMTHDPSLHYMSNLRILGQCSGARVQVCARIDPRNDNSILPLALYFSDKTRVDDTLKGLVNLGLDLLTNAHRTDTAPVLVACPRQPHRSPLTICQRWLDTTLFAGRDQTARKLATLESEGAQLQRLGMPRGKRYCLALAQSLRASERDRLGRATRPNDDGLARAWLALHTYFAATQNHLACSRWQG